MGPLWDRGIEVAMEELSTGGDPSKERGKSSEKRVMSSMGLCKSPSRPSHACSSALRPMAPEGLRSCADALLVEDHTPEAPDSDGGDCNPLCSESGRGAASSGTATGQERE